MYSVFSEFKRKVLDELVTINLKLNNVMDQVGIVVNAIRLLSDKNTEVTSKTSSETTQIMQLLPLKTDKDLKTLEKLLCDMKLQAFLVCVFLNVLHFSSYIFF